MKHAVNDFDPFLIPTTNCNNRFSKGSSFSPLARRKLLSLQVYFLSFVPPLNRPFIEIILSAL